MPTPQAGHPTGDLPETARLDRRPLPAAQPLGPGSDAPGGRPPSRGGEAWRLVVALAAYALISTLYLRPIWTNFATHIAPDVGDPLFNLYILKWVAHEAQRGFDGFWNAPFYFPARDVLAYSDHLAGPGLAAAAFAALVPEGQPRWLPAYNLLLLSSFILTGLAACFVLRRGGLGWAAAWLGGAMFAFSPFRWGQLSHLQILLMQLIPVTLWSFDRLLASPGWRRAVLFLACYLLHLSGGCYLALMIHVPLAVLLANRLPELRRDGRWRAALPVLAGTALVAAGAAGALFGKYRAVARAAGLHWGPSVERVWGASVVSYLTPSHSNLYSGIFPDQLRRPENSLFPGWAAAVLALLGAYDLWRRRGPRPAAGDVPPAAGARLTARRRTVLAALPALAVLGWLGGEARTWSIAEPGVFHFAALPRWATRSYSTPLLLLVLAGGGWLWLRRRWGVARAPRWREIDPWPRGLLAAGAVSAALTFPIFFDLAARLLPGFAAMRVPARFNAFTSLAIAWLAAAALDARISGWNLRSARRRAALLAAAGALVLLEICPRPLNWVEIEDEDDFPDVAAWIADQPDVKAVLEIPLNDPSQPNPNLVDISYMYYGTLHWKPLVNGYSAHAPYAWDWLQQRCCWPAPDASTLARLRSWGVSHLLIHRSELPLWQRQQLDRWETTGQADLLYSGGGDRVYRIRPGPAG